MLRDYISTRTYVAQIHNYKDIPDSNFAIAASSLAIYVTFYLFEVQRPVHHMAKQGTLVCVYVCMPGKTRNWTLYLRRATGLNGSGEAARLYIFQAPDLSRQDYYPSESFAVLELRAYIYICIHIYMYSRLCSSSSEIDRSQCQILCHISILKL